MKNRLQMSAVYTNITHELLTPLTVISASVDRLREQEPSHSQDYDLMQLNIERMVRLLQQILETSKSQEGGLKLLVSYGDVMNYITETARCTEPLMRRKNLTFTINCKPESMMGWIDTDKLDKIIFNLLSNAAKYTPEGGQVTLDVATNRYYNHVTIRVSDNGIGFAKDKMKHLFSRFYDGDYRRSQTFGTGLGLALTRDLVYLHKGTIDCKSIEGQGTTFTIDLPISKEAFAPSQIDEKNNIQVKVPSGNILDLPYNAPKELSDEGQYPRLDNDARTVLIVEDNQELMMLMRQLLRTKYHVLTASNGVEALDVIRENDLDIIVSDVMMPQMDGYELTRRIKQDEDMSHLPIILLTAKIQNEDQQEALTAGADDYITKPFSIKNLTLHIDNIVENRERIRRVTQTAEALEEEPAPRPMSLDDVFLKKAIECINAHLDDSDYDRDTFAADMGASASTLYNKLRALTGMNVSSFIRDIRLKAACRMAKENPELRVSDIAYRVGFKDPKYFATSFKKEMGIQPKEYFEQLRADDGASATSPKK
jgi:CheY-like chemotaxis protein